MSQPSHIYASTLHRRARRWRRRRAIWPFLVVVLGAGAAIARLALGGL